jgi:hypothetical protein
MVAGSGVVVRGINRPTIAICAFLVAALAGCALQRAETASNARTAMVGMPKEDVLACMGVPASSGGEGGTEVWGYNSGDGRVVTASMANAFTTGQSSTTGHATVLGNTALNDGHTVGSANTSGFGLGVSRHFSCNINIVFRRDV